MLAARSSSLVPMPDTSETRSSDHWTAHRPASGVKPRADVWACEPLEGESSILGAKTATRDYLASQLLEMTLVSLNGYRETADITSDPDLRAFAEVMVQQRQSQSRELAQWLATTGRACNRAGCVVAQRRLWASACWRLDASDLTGFLQRVETAEEELEVACLQAAAILDDHDMGEKLIAHALNVCGARQRLEDLSRLSD